MQRPASGQAAFEQRRVADASMLQHLRDSCSFPDGGRLVAGNRLAEELELLLTGEVDRNVQEPALNFQPFVARLARQSMGVFIESLVEDAYDDQTSLRARGGLSELLEDVDVGPAARRLLQELAHLIDHEQEAPLAARRNSDGPL